MAAPVRLRSHLVRATPHNTLRRGSLHSLRERRLDSNQEPDRYERGTLPGSSSKIGISRSRSFTFVRVCSRGFWRITGPAREISAATVLITADWQSRDVGGAELEAIRGESDAL